MIDGNTFVSLGLVLSVVGGFLFFGKFMGVVLTKLDSLREHMDAKINYMVAMTNRSEEEIKKDVNSLFNKHRALEATVGEIRDDLMVIKTQHNHNHKPRKRPVDTGE